MESSIRVHCDRNKIPPQVTVAGRRRTDSTKSATPSDFWVIVIQRESQRVRGRDHHPSRGGLTPSLGCSAATLTFRTQVSLWRHPRGPRHDRAHSASHRARASGRTRRAQRGGQLLTTRTSESVNSLASVLEVPASEPPARIVRVAAWSPAPTQIFEACDFMAFSTLL